MEKKGHVGLIMLGDLLLVEIEKFKIGDLVKYTHYDYEPDPYGRMKAISIERTNISFILDIIEDPDEKQVDMFPKILLYDTHTRRTILTHSYNIEFISRA